MEWQPIETAPKDGTKVLIADRYGNIETSRYIQEWSEKEVFVRHAKDGDVYKTEKLDWGYWDAELEGTTSYWMPLPDPPPTALKGDE